MPKTIHSPGNLTTHSKGRQPSRADQGYQGYQGRLARDKGGTFSSCITILSGYIMNWVFMMTWLSGERDKWSQNRCIEIWYVDFIMHIPVLSALCCEQGNAFTSQSWVVRSSSSLRCVMSAEPMTRDTLKRPWSHTKSQRDLGPKLELTCLVTGAVTTSPVWTTTSPFRRLIFLRTHSQQQWSGTWRLNSLGTVFQNVRIRQPLTIYFGWI